MAREPQIVSPSRREIAPAIPNYRPTAFGAGVGQALDGLASGIARASRVDMDFETARAQLESRHKDHQEQLERANANVRFIQMQGEFARAQAERARASEPGLPGFTEATNDELSRLSSDFLGSLSPELQKEFASQVESFKQSSLTNAYSAQTTAQDAKFLGDFGTLTQTAVDNILSSSGDASTDAERWLGQLERTLDMSPLSETEKDAQYKSAEVAVRSAQYSKELVEENLGNIHHQGVTHQVQSRNGVYSSSRPVASGLPAVAVGLLNAIAGPESNGQYNRRYDGGQGAQYFEPGETWQHPNIATTITEGDHEGQKSTAAGRYMFINGTWKTVAARYGLEDFSPENQDIGAWNHAQDYYAQATGGGSLEAVLRSGDPAQIERARLILAKEWAGLKSVNKNSFLAQVTQQTGNPSALFNAPEFSMIPYVDRMALMAEAGAQADKVRAEMKSEYDTQTAVLMRSLEQQLLDGSAGPVQIEALADERGLTVGETDKLRTLWEESNSRAAAALAIGEKLVDPNATFVNDQTQRDQLDAAFEFMKVPEKMAEGDTEFFENQVLPIVSHSQIVPEGLYNTLVRNIYSQDTELAQANWDALAMIAAEAPAAWAVRASDDLETQVAAYNALRGYYPPKDIVERLRGSNDPSVAANRANNRKLVNQIVTDNPDEWRAAGIARKIGLGKNAVLDSASSTAIQTEAYELFSRAYELTGNESSSWDMVEEMMSRRWGNQDLNGVNRVMKYPPNKFFPTYDGSHDYISDEFFAGLDRSDAFFISDATTEREVAEERPPSYQVMTYDTFGNPKLLTQGDLPNTGRASDSFMSMPLRYTPEITEEMQEQLIERNIEKEARKNEQRDISAQIRALDPSQPGYEERLEQLQQQQRSGAIASTVGIRVAEDVDLTGEAIGGGAIELGRAIIDALPGNETVERPYFPGTKELHKLLGNGIFLPMETLENEMLPNSEREKAYREILLIMDQKPWSMQLHELDKQLEQFVVEQGLKPFGSR